MMYERILVASCVWSFNIKVLLSCIRLISLTNDAIPKTLTNASKKELFSSSKTYSSEYSEYSSEDYTMTEGCRSVTKTGSRCHQNSKLGLI